MTAQKSRWCFVVLAALAVAWCLASWLLAERLVAERRSRFVEREQEAASAAASNDCLPISMAGALTVAVATAPAPAILPPAARTLAALAAARSIFASLPCCCSICRLAAARSPAMA